MIQDIIDFTLVCYAVATISCQIGGVTSRLKRGDGGGGEIVKMKVRAPVVKEEGCGPRDEE